MRNGIITLAGLCALLLLPVTLPADDSSGGGLTVSLDNISRLENVQSRSISPENFTGEKGRAGMATNGTGKGRVARIGPGMESFAIDWHQGAQHYSPWPKSPARAASAASG